MLIVGPHVHEEQYINRHQTHSLNVQITCDANMRILNVLARHPGATHDSFVWANSALRAKLETLFRNGKQCWLIGDSGYSHEPWLHIPFTDAAPESPEANFNKALMIDRSVVERTIGHLRNRFRCLNKHRVLEYAPEKAGLVVNGCVVLHNMCVQRNVPMEDDDSTNDDDEEEVDNVSYIPAGPVRDRLRMEARAIRDRIVARIPRLPQPQPINPRRPHRRQ